MFYKQVKKGRQNIFREINKLMQRIIISDEILINSNFNGHVSNKKTKYKRTLEWYNFEDRNEATEIILYNKLTALCREENV